MKEQRRSGIRIMSQLIGLVAPLLPVMILAILLGVLGFLCAIFLTIFAGYELMSLFSPVSIQRFNFQTFAILLITIGILRGILHYGEQYCNHFIAFRLLAIVRHKVFAVLRKLCPAKLEGRDKGNLVSIITTDIELLEVFYAHTISPICIGTITSVIMAIFIGRQSLAAGVLAAVAYFVVGVCIPLAIGGRGSDYGMRFREKFGDLNSFILASLYGVDETIQYQNGEKRQEALADRSVELSGIQKYLSRLEGAQRAVTNLAILGFSFGMLFLMVYQYQKEMVGFSEMLIAVIAMMGSFGPVVALANLANNLSQTLAAGERVLSLLEEIPVVEEVPNGKQIEFTGADASAVNFSYGQERILSDFTMKIPKGKVIGIHGASGCGKSTFLKLLMRFWDIQSGNIRISDTEIKEIQTDSLRSMQSYVTQETFLFHDTIAKNIEIGKLGATQEEIEEAAKKASIHDFIIKLPNGYETEVAECGDSLSGGERQRIGMARAFLHDGEFLLLDEPTSNLDSLNEGIILKSLKESIGKKTVLLVSHTDNPL